MRTAPPFPLPVGHVFGPPGDLRYHDGRVIRDSLGLRRWQAALHGYWCRPNCLTSGLYDGRTQRAVYEVQEVLGRPRTGLLGAEEWPVPWETPRPRKPLPEPPPKPTPWESRQAARDRKKKWLRHSNHRVQFGTDPDAPPWYPGRPFGPHEIGDHVRRVQEILGLTPSGRYTLQMTQRIRGWQRAMGLPVSGVVDIRTACLLDPPQQAETPHAS